jgi:alkylhydroperoxidase family enzyme
MAAMHDRFKPARDATAASVLTSPATTSPELRQAVAGADPPAELKTLVEKIRTRAYTVTTQDVDALRSRYTEDQLFEIIIAAAFGAARERLAAAHRALEQA